VPKAIFVHAAADLYGSDLVCLRVVQGARAAGWDVDVTVPSDGPLVSSLRAEGAGVLRVDPLKPRRADLRPARLPSTLARWIRNYRALRGLRAGDYDLVYTTTAPTTGGALLARWLDVPHVYHVHEIFWFPKPLVRGFERMVRTADVVLCCSRAVLDQFTDQALRRRSRVVYSGAEVPAGIDERSPLSDDSLRIVCVARLNEWKGQEVLIEAIPLLERGTENVSVRLIGDVFSMYGTERQYRDGLVERVRALGLGDVVHFEGERRDALAVVAQADVFVLPSRRPEPFGMALVEAMALGRPVVATEAGGPLEIVTDGVDGVLVAPGDPAALASAIDHMVRDPEWARRLADQARRRASDFTSQTMVTQVLAAFGDAIAARGRGTDRS